jgi:hypothetical protein
MRFDWELRDRDFWGGQGEEGERKGRGANGDISGLLDSSRVSQKTGRGARETSFLILSPEGNSWVAKSKDPAYLSGGYDGLRLD